MVETDTISLVLIFEELTIEDRTERQKDAV